MAKNTYIENYIDYQKATDKPPMTLASYRSDLIQFTVWFEGTNNEVMRLTA
jgi:integrase/recombinase XerC